MITTYEIILLNSHLAKLVTVCRGEWGFAETYFPIVEDLDEVVNTLLDIGGLLEFLASGGNIEPIVKELQGTMAEYLDCAGNARDEIAEYLEENGEPTADLLEGVCNTMKDLVNLCGEWIGWIERYFPGQAQPTRQDVNQEPTAAAKRLASLDLQEVKKELVEAGLIVEGRWDGTPAEYAELVRHLKEDCSVENRGGYAWKDCRPFAGYQGSDKSAQNAITANQGDIRGARAATIRRICQRHKVR